MMTDKDIMILRENEMDRKAILNLCAALFETVNERDVPGSSEDYMRLEMFEFGIIVLERTSWPSDNFENAIVYVGKRYKDVSDEEILESIHQSYYWLFEE